MDPSGGRTVRGWDAARSRKSADHADRRKGLAGGRRAGGSNAGRRIREADGAETPRRGHAHDRPRPLCPVARLRWLDLRSDGLPGPLRRPRRHDAAEHQLFKRHHYLHQNGGRLARRK